MENFILNIFKRLFSPVLLAGLLFLSPFEGGAQQQKSYEILPAPDLWYNDVDGIRAGLRVRGQVPGTFDDGPHRLDVGVWISTWLPENPVSFYLSYTEPIPAFTDFGNEGNIQLVSSIRTGFQLHSLALNKRWQAGFEERNYKEFSLNFRLEDRFDSEYLLYPELWTAGTLWLAGVNFELHDEHALGRYSMSTSHSANIAGSLPLFISSSLQFQQHIPLSDYFDIRARIFAGSASNDSNREYLFSHSFKQARKWMDSGLTRAKGTIPVGWMDEGVFQIAGGANLRGYLDADIETLNDSGRPAPLYQSIGALNLELDYLNPLDQTIQKIPLLGDFLRLRSYIFFDTGITLGLGSEEKEDLISNAGPGFLFSIDIPDYLGKSRGIMIRYDIPLWLSHPGDGNHWAFRNLIGIGAVISL